MIRADNTVISDFFVVEEGCTDHIWILGEEFKVELTLEFLPSLAVCFAIVFDGIGKAVADLECEYGTVDSICIVWVDVSACLSALEIYLINIEMMNASEWFLRRDNGLVQSRYLYFTFANIYQYN